MATISKRALRASFLEALRTRRATSGLSYGSNDRREMARGFVHPYFRRWLEETFVIGGELVSDVPGGFEGDLWRILYVVRQGVDDRIREVRLDRGHRVCVGHNENVAGNPIPLEKECKPSMFGSMLAEPSQKEAGRDWRTVPGKVLVHAARTVELGGRCRV